MTFYKECDDCKEWFDEIEEDHFEDHDGWKDVCIVCSEKRRKKK